MAGLMKFGPGKIPAIKKFTANPKKLRVRIAQPKSIKLLKAPKL